MKYPWLFSARVDLTVFLGSALLAFAALLLAPHQIDTPDWTWVPAVLLVDVAHVWSTGFRVYTDGAELRRRPLLYFGAPAIGLCISIALYSQGELVFWRALAYLAVFHFVRQQYGWVMMYRARAGETRGRAIDTAAIYAATLYPLLYWHTHLPRHFWWFLPGDFAAGLPLLVNRIAAPLYALALAAYAVRAFRSPPNPGKHIVVATTAACWYVGIIGLDSDYAFTVTNVLIHGIPYLALIYWYGRSRGQRVFARGPLPMLALIWMIAFAEELLWDRGVWHDRSWLFGAAWDWGAWKTLLVPLLALPQLTHYVLDGFVWRRKDPALAAVFSPHGRQEAGAAAAVLGRGSADGRAAGAERMVSR